MALSGLSLNAATVTGVGSTITFDKPVKRIAMQTYSTGSPSSYQVQLQLSLDGVNFTSSHSLNTSLTTDSISSVSNLFVEPYIAARANLISLSGGTSPTVSAFIGADY